MSRVLVTGSSGLVGRSLVETLKVHEWQVRASSRSPAVWKDGVELVRVHDQGPASDWSVPLRDVQAVVHLAARVHVMNDSADENRALRANMETNFLGTMRLAEEAAKRGVDHFVFISSVKVNGDASPLGRPLSETDHVKPSGPYAESKYRAELALGALSRNSGMSVTIIRPPLVYGPSVRGNFRSLMRCVQGRIPLPLLGVRNRRSLVSADNLSDFIACVLSQSAARGETFFVSDDDDISSPELVRRIGRALQRRPLLFPVPESVLRKSAQMVGKGAVSDRLLGTLQLDITKAEHVFAWRPRYSMQEGLQRTVVHADR